MASEANISGEKILSLINQRASTADASLRVDIIADFVCPWSYLGWRRFDRAARAFDGSISKSWFPFQLNPDMPSDGMAFDDYIQNRFGDLEALRPALEQLMKTGRNEQIEFNFERIEHVPNTLKAHCLVREAAPLGLQDVLAERLFQSFFEFGEDIGRKDVLARVGQQCGLSSEQINLALDSDAVRESVVREEATARQAGVSGVPNILLNKRVFVVGAQDAEQMVGAIDRAIFGDSSEHAENVLH